MQEAVKIIAFFLFPSGRDSVDFLEEASALFGKVDYRGAVCRFDGTDYYEKEMGKGLCRRLLGFCALEDAALVADWKKSAMGLEQRFAKGQKRSFNLDIGYMDPDKVVLPSCKRGPFKIYARNGIWLDMVFHYAKGHFMPMDWTFPDFRTGFYEKDLLVLRNKMKRDKRVLSDE